MDESSKAVAVPSKSLEPPVTDTTIAQNIVQEAFPVTANRNIKAAIGDAFEALKRRERTLPADVLRRRPRQWTERRVRSLWHREARRIDHYEINDLAAVAVEEARIERQRVRARAARLEALLASAMASASGAGSERVGGRLGGLVLPGTSDADADYDQREFGED